MKPNWSQRLIYRLTLKHGSEAKQMAKATSLYKTRQLENFWLLQPLHKLKLQVWTLNNLNLVVYYFEHQPSKFRFFPKQLNQQNIFLNLLDHKMIKRRPNFRQQTISKLVGINKSCSLNLIILKEKKNHCIENSPWKSSFGGF